MQTAYKLKEMACKKTCNGTENDKIKKDGKGNKHNTEAVNRKSDETKSLRITSTRASLKLWTPDENQEKNVLFLQAIKFTAQNVAVLVVVTAVSANIVCENSLEHNIGRVNSQL